MTISVNLNLAASAALALGRAQSSAARATEQLASGRRINSAADDAAGLAIAMHMTSRVRGLAVGARNALDAVSLTQTASGGLDSIAANLQRLRELAVQAANATNSASDRAALQAEAAQLVNEIDRIGSSTRFNGLSLLDGSFSAADFQVGADAGQTIRLGALADVRAAALGNPLAIHSTLGGNTLTAASTITGPGQLVINGVDVWRGSPIVADAKVLAAAINAAGLGGLTATAAATVAVGSYSAVGADGQFNIDGQGAWTFHHGALSAGAAIADTINLINSGQVNLITDGGFEDGALPAAPLNYVYGPSDEHPWSMSNAGITGNGGGFTDQNAPIPEGQIAAFIQNGQVLSQDFVVGNSGSYDLSFQMAQRLNFGGPQVITVLIDGQQLLQLNPSGNWALTSVPSISLGAGSHTLSFVGGAVVDGTAFLDDVRLTASGATPPRPVVASDNGTGVTLTAADGGNIRLNMASGAPQILGLGGIAYGVGSDGITYSHVDLAYDGNSALTITGSQAAALGFGGTPLAQSGHDVVAALDLSTVAGANLAIDTIDGALSSVDGQRAGLGAAENRLRAAVTSIESASADAQAARSRIVDTDYAQAVGELTRAGILQQAGLAMVAQANAHVSDVLRLLRG